MGAILRPIYERVEEYDETMARRLIERITVYDEKYVVEFKSGVEVDIEM